MGSQASCPGCGSHRLERDVPLSRKSQWLPFIQDAENCPLKKYCAHWGSERCSRCHRKQITIRVFYTRSLRKTWKSISISDVYVQSLFWDWGRYPSFRCRVSARFDDAMRILRSWLADKRRWGPKWWLLRLKFRCLGHV